MTTVEGLQGTVIQVFSSAANGENHENQRYYHLAYVPDTINNACLYSHDPSSPVVSTADDPGENVLSGIDLDVCLTFADPGTMKLMSDELVWPKRGKNSIYTKVTMSGLMVETIRCISRHF